MNHTALPYSNKGPSANKILNNSYNNLINYFNLCMTKWSDKTMFYNYTAFEFKGDNKQLCDNNFVLSI